MSNANPSDNADMLLSVQEFRRRRGGIGRTKVWEMIRDGELRYVRITPRKIAVPLSELRRLIIERTEGGHSIQRD